ncbi:MAG TPA: Crp/Fnr family transcriptional regulator, partial [Candidatus Saccharimonadales bacterium]|nr:Crp/Fnr family transcriptional regulator [Candidatus Saccharimonadales bacterium]
RHYAVGRHQILQSYDDRFRPLVNMVKSGYIKRYEIGNDGSLSVQAIYGPGDVFPLTLVFKALFNQNVYEGPEVIYYETITEAELSSMDVGAIADAVKNNPLLYKDLLYEAGVRTQSNIQRLENLSLKSSLRRTAHQLIYFARQFGELRFSTIRIKVALTHQDIADVLSLTRETVSINLRKLQQRGLIKPGRYIEVVDLASLEDEAYGKRLA